MIILTRLGGHQMAVNPDLIERAEPTPDTVLTMVDGHKIVVAESVRDVVDAVRTWRASVAAEAFGRSSAAGADADGVRAALDEEGELVDASHLQRAADVVGHAALGAGLARVLRLPVTDRDGQD